MQASDRVLAWRYGRALFEAALAKKEEGKVHQELQAAQSAIRELLPALRHPRVSVADKKKKLEGALQGKVSPVAMKFLGLLIEKKRFEILPMVIADLAKLVAEKNNEQRRARARAHGAAAERRGATEAQGQAQDFCGKEHRARDQGRPRGHRRSRRAPGRLGAGL
jgi:hypothetical protein